MATEHEKTELRDAISYWLAECGKASKDARVVRLLTEAHAALSTPAPADASGCSCAEIAGEIDAILDRASGTYKARNGRMMGIEADDGEKCWIIHSDDLNELRQIAERLATPTPPRPIDMGEIERALEPFSKAADVKLCAEPGYWSDEKSIKNTDVASGITFGDLRRARQALAAIKGEGAWIEENADA